MSNDKVTTDAETDLPENEASTTEKNIESRRKVLKGTLAGAGATALMPEGWINPVINTVVIPAHAQMSPNAATSSASTTSPGSGTTAPATTAPATTAPATTAPATTAPATTAPATTAPATTAPATTAPATTLPLTQNPE